MSGQERKFSAEAPNVGRSSFSFFSATCMIRSGCKKGSERIITAFTTVNMVALAAMAIVTVRTTVAANIGARRIIRIANRKSPANAPLNIQVPPYLELKIVG
jgi:hypothetical protein